MLLQYFYDAHSKRGAARTYPTPDEYFHVRTVEQEFKVAGITSPAKVKMWFRPLEGYISQLRESGFT